MQMAFNLRLQLLSPPLIVFILGLTLCTFTSASTTAGTVYAQMNHGDSPGLHIPLRRFQVARSSRYHLSPRYLYSEIQGQNTGNQISMSDFKDVTYKITINVGGTQLVVDVDTGSSDLWVIADTCTLPACKQIAVHSSKSNVRLYPQPNSDASLHSDKSNFNSTHLPASLFFGDSLTGTHAFGVIGTDTVEIGSDTLQKTHERSGPVQPPALKTQYFVAINDTNTSVLETGCVGILGLGFPLNSALCQEVFENDHPELGSTNPPDSSWKDKNGSNSHTDSHGKRNNALGTRRRWGSPTIAERYGHLNRRMFPDLSKFTGSELDESDHSEEVSTNQDSKANSSSMGDVKEGDQTQDGQENKGRRRSMNVQDRDLSSHSPSLWTPLLLSAFDTYGPPVWRLVASTTDWGQAEKVPTYPLKPMFSITLQRETNIDDTSDPDDQNSGILTIGGLPAGVNEGELTWVNVRRYGVEDGGLQGGPGAEHEVYPITWEIPIDDVFFDGEKLPRSELVDPEIGITGLIDTGNSLVRGPPDIMQYIGSLLQGKGDQENPRFNSCASHTIAFQIGGQMFPVDPRDFFWRSDDGACYPNIAPTDVPARSRKKGEGRGYLYSWSLGDPFLKSVRAAFYYGNTTHPSCDPPRIGLKSTVPEEATSPEVSWEVNNGEGTGVIQRPELPFPEVLVDTISSGEAVD